MEYHLGREKHENNTLYFFFNTLKNIYVCIVVSDITLKGMID